MGQPTLIAWALVATWWTGPSQRRLFSAVLVHASNYERWVNGVVNSRSKAQLLEHVRLLSLNQYQMQDLSQDHGEYLPGLCNVRRLVLYRARIHEAQFHPCFSAFRGTLTSLSIDAFTSFGAFVALVDYFPNLRKLELYSHRLQPNDGPVPSLSRPLRGELHLHPSMTTHLEFLSQFSKLDLEYEALVIDSSLFGEPSLLETALQISPNTVKFLKMPGKSRGK